MARQQNSTPGPADTIDVTTVQARRKLAEELGVSEIELVHAVLEVGSRLDDVKRHLAAKKGGAS